MTKEEMRSILSQAIIALETVDHATEGSNPPALPSLVGAQGLEVTTRYGRVVVQADGKVLVDTSVLQKSFSESYKTLSRGVFIASGPAGSPCSYCGGTGRN